MSEQISRFVGLDWGSEVHVACVIDAEREVLDELSVAHSGEALQKLTIQLQQHGKPEQIGVAIEVSRGPVVETLLERGFRVFALNPKQLDRFRDRHSVSGAKDDRRDAFVLADSLRTDQHAFREVSLDDPDVIALRELSRIDEDHKTQWNALGNRMRQQLHRYYPQVLKLSKQADEPWIWALLEKAPTPAKAKRLRRPSVQALLRAHRIRRFDADEVLAVLKEEPLIVAPGATEAAWSHIEYLIPQLRLLHQQRRDVARRLEAVLQKLSEPEGAQGQPGEHRDAAVLLSLPGVGIKVAATMLSEAAQPIAERDHAALRALSGVAPITRASGKRSGPRAKVTMRRACNGRLRNATYHWARVASQRDPYWKATYEALRRKGHSHGRACRTVADRLLRALCAMLRDHTLYDASRFKVIDRLAA